MAITVSQLNDLVTTTQAELGRMKWTDLSGDLQEYTAFEILMKKNRAKFDSGTSIKFNIMKTTSGAAAHVGLYAVDNYNVGDVMVTGDIPWRHSNTNYSVDRREVTMNASPSKIVDLVKVRRADAMIDLAKLVEVDVWSKPATSSDTTSPYGVFMYLVYNATTGFNGGDPSGFTAGTAGLATATYPRWKNYTAQYTNISKADLITKWRSASRKTLFRPPVSIPSQGNDDRYGYYCNEATLVGIEDICEQQNDKLGNDVASKDGSTLFHKRPITYVPELDNHSGGPILGINWSSMNFTFLKGEYMKEASPRQAPNQHTVSVVDVDLTWNLVCRNRRANFLLATADPA